MSTYYVPSINIMGAGCLQELGPAISDLGFKKALVVTDKFLVSCGIAEKVTNELKCKIKAINMYFILFIDHNTKIMLLLSCYYVRTYSKNNFSFSCRLFPMKLLKIESKEV